MASGFQTPKRGPTAPPDWTPSPRTPRGDQQLKLAGAPLFPDFEDVQPQSENKTPNKNPRSAAADISHSAPRASQCAAPPSHRDEQKALAVLRSEPEVHREWERVRVNRDTDSQGDFVVLLKFNRHPSQLDTVLLRTRWADEVRASGGDPQPPCARKAKILAANLSQEYAEELASELDAYFGRYKGLGPGHVFIQKKNVKDLKTVVNRHFKPLGQWLSCTRLDQSLDLFGDDDDDDDVDVQLQAFRLRTLWDPHQVEIRHSFINVIFGDEQPGKERSLSV